MDLKQAISKICTACGISPTDPRRKVLATLLNAAADDLGQEAYIIHTATEKLDKISLSGVLKWLGKPDVFGTEVTEDFLDNPESNPELAKYLGLMSGGDDDGDGMSDGEEEEDEGGGKGGFRSRLPRPPSKTGLLAGIIVVLLVVVSVLALALNPGGINTSSTQGSASQVELSAPSTVYAETGPGGSGFLVCEVTVDSAAVQAYTSKTMEPESQAAVTGPRVFVARVVGVPDRVVIREGALILHARDVGIHWNTAICNVQDPALFVGMIAALGSYAPVVTEKLSDSPWWVIAASILAILYALYNKVAEARQRGNVPVFLMATVFFSVIFVLAFRVGTAGLEGFILWILGTLGALLWANNGNLSYISKVVLENTPEDERPFELVRELLIGKEGFKRFAKQFEWSNLDWWFSLCVFMAIIFPQAAPLVGMASMGVVAVVVINFLFALGSAVLETYKRDDPGLKDEWAVVASVLFGGVGPFLAIHFLDSLLNRFLPGVTNVQNASEAFLLFVFVAMMFLLNMVVPKGANKSELDRAFDAGSLASTCLLVVLVIFA